MESATSQALHSPFQQATSPDHTQSPAQAQTSAGDSQNYPETRQIAASTHDQLPDEEQVLPDGDLTQTPYWPRAPVAMIEKSDIVMAQNEMIIKSIHFNDQKAEERHRIV
jgi:hypothetical protein